MEILGLGSYHGTGEPGVLLIDSDSTTVLPIFLDPCDVDVISLGLSGISFPRPLTYDLLATILESVGAGVPWVLIDVTDQGGLRADVALRLGGSETRVSSTVSNAIALGQRTGATLLVSSGVLEEYAVPAGAIEGLAKWVLASTPSLESPLTSAASDTLDVPDSLYVDVLNVLLYTQSSTIFLLDEQETVLFALGIDICQGMSISMAIEDVETPVPGLHDLFTSALDVLEIEMVRATIVDLQDGIFIATITFAHRGRLLDIDARPSDSIALSVRTGAPIFILGELAARYGLDASEYREEIEMLRGGG